MKQRLLISVCLVGCLTPFASADLATLSARQKKIDAALTKVTPALVSVQDGYGAGSGVVVSPEGIVLTASHVVETRRRRPPLLTVVFGDGSKYRARLLGMNRNADAAMLKITERYRPGPNFPYVKLGRSSELKRATGALHWGIRVDFDLTGPLRCGWGESFPLDTELLFPTVPSCWVTPVALCLICQVS